MNVERDTVRFEAGDYLRMLKQRWLAFLIGSAGTAVCVAAVFTLVPPSFMGHAVLKVEPGDSKSPFNQQASTAPRSASLNFLNTEAYAVLSPENLDAVVLTRKLNEKWGKETRKEARNLLQEKLRVVPRAKSNLIDVYAASRDPEEAALLANEVAKSFVVLKQEEMKSRAAELVAAVEMDLIRQQEKVTKAKDAVDMLRLQESKDEEQIRKLDGVYQTQSGLLRSMEARFQGVNLAAVAGSHLGSVAVHQNAELPTQPNIPSLWLLGVVTFLLSVAGGTVVALLPVSISRGGEVIGRLERQLSLDLVTFVNRGRVLLLENPQDCRDDAEAYRSLRTRLQKMPLGPSRMIAMVACTENEGRSEAVVNAASVFADSGKSVLLIDADIQRPSLHSIFAASQHPGLSDFLRGEMRLEETVVKTHYPNLWFMPTGVGCPDSCSLLAGKRMIDLIWEMKGRFDYIFLNSPPIFGASDAMVLTGYADQTLLIADHCKHSVKGLKRAKKMVEMSGGNFSGLILNSLPSRKSQRSKNAGPAKVLQG